nr:MAG TPA_asm: hypothetical protein [Caudoviricetes sp.]DAV04364.1 MAG TPA: hypothetical protein [Caudoviricetes sp.]
MVFSSRRTSKLGIPAYIPRELAVILLTALLWNYPMVCSLRQLLFKFI